MDSYDGSLRINLMEDETDDEETDQQPPSSHIDQAMKDKSQLNKLVKYE